jgi:hypothetical protein
MRFVWFETETQSASGVEICTSRALFVIRS